VNVQLPSTVAPQLGDTSSLPPATTSPVYVYRRVSAHTTIAIEELRTELLRLCPNSQSALTAKGMRDMIKTNNASDADKVKDKNGQVVFTSGDRALRLQYRVPGECRKIFDN
jgi:hypothetical protein